MNTIRAVAGDARVLIAVDDAQWLDADTTRLLSTAATWLTDLPVAWLVAVRGDQATPEVAQVVLHELGPRCQRFHLPGLPAPTLARLVLDRFPGEWSPGLLRRIIELAAGNPYTAVEVARETVAAGGRDAALAVVPATLTESLRARIGRLPTAALATAQICALTPRPTRRVLRAVLGGQPVDDAVDVALDAGVLDATPPDPVLRFTHPLLQEAVHDSLAASRRRRLHRRLAAVVDDPVDVAGHLAAGTEEPDEVVATTVANGAEQAWRRGAAARAAALAESAIALYPDPDGPETWELRIGLLDCLDRAREHERARRLAEKWASRVPRQLRGELTFRRGILAADYNVGQQLLVQAVHELHADPAKAAWVGCFAAARAGGTLSRFAEGRAFAEQAVRDARASKNAFLLRRALSVLGDLARRIGDPDAGAILREAVAVPGSTTPDGTADYADLFLAFWYFCRGELAPARELLHRLLAAGELLGWEETATDARLHLAEVEWAAGHWALADQYAQAVAQSAREISEVQAGCVPFIQALIAAGYGQVERARALAIGGIRAAEQQGDVGFGNESRCVLGRLELSVDNPAAAVTWLEPVRCAVERGLGTAPSAIGAPDLIEAYARVGRTDEAAHLLQVAQQVTARTDNPLGRITDGRTAAVLKLAHGDPSAAIDAVTPAVPEARRLGLPLELGRCLLVLGTAQRRARRRRNAATTLDEAIAVFGQLGAPCWTALARAQRERLAHAAVDVLTPTEQRIAELVAQGRTNAEIAATLLISVKTVEGALTRIYRKLGVRGRIDLARRAAT